MKKLLKSLALVFVLVFGLCAFSACGKDDKKDPEPPTPTNLTNAQVKTVLSNFYNKLSANIGDGDNWDILPNADSPATSNYSKLGLSDSGFSALEKNEQLKAHIQYPLQGVATIAALRNESETIGKAFSITGMQSNLYVASANTEKIVIQVLTQMPASIAGTETGTSNYCSIVELYLNSDATNVSQMVTTITDGNFYSLSFDGNLKVTHLIFIGQDCVDLQNKKVNSVLEFNFLAMKGYFNADTQSNYEAKTIDSEATGKSIYTALYKTEPTTIEATVSQSFEGKELKPIALDA